MVKIFEEMSIYDLRNYARVSGVSSPTTKRKHELITEITIINQGNFSALPKSRRGRPPKFHLVKFNDKTFSNMNLLVSKQIIRELKIINYNLKKNLEIFESIKNLLN